VKKKTIVELLLSDGPSQPRIDAGAFLSLLGDGLWHVTSPARYEGILQSAAILPEPAIPDSERWKTAAGPKHYPFVRSLGGVSLFDFKGFDPVAYDAYYVFSSWREFVPYRHEWGAAIWIEIDRSRAAGSVIRAKDLLDRWKKDNAHAHTLMPMIEAAHIGSIRLDVFSRVLSVDGKSGRIVNLPLPPNRPFDRP
jgi:hypothetical protein